MLNTNGISKAGEILSLEEELKRAKEIGNGMDNDDFIRFAIVAMKSAEQQGGPLKVKIKIFRDVLIKLCEAKDVILQGYYVSVADNYVITRISQMSKGFEFYTEIPSDDFRSHYFAAACQKDIKPHKITQKQFSTIAAAAMDLAYEEATVQNKNAKFADYIDGFSNVLGDRANTRITYVCPESVENNIEILEDNNPYSFYYKYVKESNIYYAKVL
ncbi:hypothetical protein DFR58_1463 [Anaerobacterium chartisolvens]|uniref:Uncharacterized protein n=1 Tax=Anaerobacterium chartisolvens TaxID=1297424 RepID=A0A369AIC0_9FIRM|nr:hypothetical protein [Anaerobacterium chartisolvens]RCX08078.1 hypothetical protein DFR58_1463 [Anaerobacterium chartisolvens]